MSIYQGILLIYLARKQFVVQHHSLWGEIASVGAIASYFSVIQYLHIPIPDSLVIVILFVYLKVFSDASTIRCILYTFLDGIIFAGTLMLVSYLFDIQVRINGSLWSVSSETQIIYSLTANAALTVVVNIAAHFTKTYDGASYKETVIFIVMLVLEFAVSELLFTARMSENSNRLLAFNSLGVFLIMLLTVFFYEHLTEMARIRHIREMEQNTILLVHEHQEELQVIYKEMLKQQHDLRHRVNAAYEILSSNTVKAELRDSVMQLLELPEQEQHYFTGSIAVDAVLKSKQAVMQNAGINFTCNEYPLLPLPIPERDFCVLLSNLLDNAIEGVMKLPANHISRNVILNFSKVWEMLFIKCSNDAVVSEIRCSNGDFVSTKPHPESHGFGTKSMKKIVESAGGFIEFNLSEDSFSVQIMLGENEKC